MRTETQGPGEITIHVFSSDHVFGWDEMDWIKTLLRSGFAIFVQNGPLTDNLRVWARRRGYRFHKHLRYRYGGEAIAWLPDFLKEEYAPTDARSQERDVQYERSILPTRSYLNQRTRRM